MVTNPAPPGGTHCGCRPPLQAVAPCWNLLCEIGSPYSGCCGREGPLHARVGSWTRVLVWCCVWILVHVACVSAPKIVGMFSLSTLLQRRPDEQSGRSHTDPHARRTTAQWACDVVHDRAYAMLGRITRHRQRGATTPRWASCCKEKACLDLRKICTVGSENGTGNVAARRHTAHGPQLSFC